MPTWKSPVLGHRPRLRQENRDDVFRSLVYSRRATFSGTWKSSLGRTANQTPPVTSPAALRILRRQCRRRGRKAAIGLGQLAELYSKAASQRLQDTISKIGVAMAAEKDTELQTLLSAAFVRLSQESAARRCIAPCNKLSIRSPTWKARAPVGCKLCAHVGVDRIPEFIEEAMVADAGGGLVGVLMRVPQTAAEHLAVRLARTSRRTERESVVHLAKAVGAPCVRYLKESLKNDAPAKAATVIGLLSRLDPGSVDELLPRRLRDGGRGFHDAVVRQLSTAGAPERGKLLSDSLEMFGVLIVPLALDRGAATPKPHQALAPC